MKLIQLLILAATAALVASCASGSRSGALAGVEIPTGRERVGPSLWMAAGGPGPELQSSRATQFPLPVVSIKNRLGVNEERTQADSSHYRMIGLGVPYAYLPLEFSFSRALYTPDEELPTARLIRRWSPFWSWSKVEGDLDDVLEVDVSGIPILWEKGYESGPAWYFDDFETGFDTHMEFDFFTLFWWIGPMSFDLRRTWTDDDGEEWRRNGRYFTPLFLGRGPGFLLWSDYRETENGPNGRVETRGHGPLLGWPGYISTRETRPAGGARLDRLVLGGILWNDRVERDESYITQDSVHGPLWGMFGWGKKDGRGAASVFWIPIKL